MKKTLLLLLAALPLLCSAAAGELPFSYEFAAPTLAGQPQHADPGFQKLLAKTRQTPVIWRYGDNKKRPVVIKCHFLPGTKLAEVEFAYFRPHAVRKHTINYGIKNVKVFGISPDGKKFPLGGAVLNQPYAKPDGEPEQARIRIALEAHPVADVELHFTGNNGRLALYGLLFKGNAPPPEKPDAKPAVSPWQKEIDSAGTALDVRYNGSCYILENPHVIYAVSPEDGGCVVFAYDRGRKVNLIRQGISSTDWGPFFQDRFYPGGSKAKGAFSGSRFRAEPPQKTPGKITLRLRGKGKNGHFTGVLIEKRFHLRADSPVLEVDYAIHNLIENVVPLCSGFWSVGGVDSANGYKMVVPGAREVQEIGFFPGYREFPELSGNWYAARTPEDNALGCIMPGELLKTVCFWTSGTHRGTLECKFGLYHIAAGDALRFTSYLVPFGGIGKPDGLSPAAAGSIDERKLKLQLFRQGKFDLEFHTALLDQGQPRWKKVRSLALGKLGKYHTIPLPEGKYDAVLVQLREKGKTVLRLEKSLSGKTFPLTPAAVKRKESSVGGPGGLRLNFNSLAVKSPHWEWAVPLSGKPPRVLGIGYKSGAIRDMVEIALRCGIKFDTHYIADRWSLTNHQDLNEAQCVKELEKVLKKTYDCLAVTGNAWKKFTPAVKTAILQKVESGTGLILVAPTDLPEELGRNCRIVPDRKTLPQEKWKKGAFSPVTAGLPIEALPPSAVTPYTVKGNVLIEAKGLPLLAEFSVGKGKVFVFTYPAADHKSKLSRSSFFLPRMEQISPLPEWAYHEYQIALWARIICDAAGWRSPVRSGEFRRAGTQKFVLTLDAALPAETELRYRIRDRFSALTGDFSKKIRLNEGKNAVDLELPELPAMNGRFFVNVKVCSPGGVLWWGSVSGENKAPGSIEKVQFPNKVYRKTDPLKGSVAVTGRGKLLVSIFDNKGNCFGRSGGSDFAFSLAPCTTPSGFVRAELTADGRTIDRKEERFDLYFTPDPLNYNVAMGWPSVSLRAHLFNYKVFLDQLARFGITCLNGDRYTIDLPSAEKALRDFGWPQFSTQTYGFLGTKKPYDRNLVPKHKFELVRRPCLSSPAFRKQLDIDSARLYPNHVLGALMVAGPDESNMFGQWDGCFTPDCREKLRVWLKGEYGTLDRLNASWQTDFKKWDEVTAMTLSEVRNRRSFAPWMDHRTFNDWNRADALKQLAQGIRKTAPLGYSFSGTQETNPFNAWDWYRMMPLLGGVSSYYGEQTIQHRSFARGKFYQMPWIGYDSPYKRMDRQLWTALMNGATGINLYGGAFYIQQDFTLSSTADALIHVVSRWTKGVGQTLQPADVPVSSIAVHYSPGSIKVNEVLEVTALRQSAVAGIKTLLNEENLSYIYLAYGEIEKGQFKDAKVLFLPLSSALSPAEVRNITAFVENGGVVIADMLAGLYDAHGAPAQTGSLDALFGLKKRGRLLNRPGTASLGGGRIKVLSYETGTVPAEKVRVLGKNPDGSPAVLVNARGKGMTVYLANSLFSACGDLQEVRYSEANAPIMKAMRELLLPALKLGGISAPFRVPGLRSAEVLIRDLGRIRFVGVGRNFEETANAGIKAERKKVFLDREYHIYDLFTRNYLGCGREFEFEFAPDGQEIFALLPYRIEDVSAEIASRGENRFEVRIRVAAGEGESTFHTLRVELADPTGKVRPEYSSWVRTDRGRASWQWTAPLNAPEGKWHLRITETISGKSRTLELPVRP